MSDDDGKKIGAAAGAGGLGLMALLRVCSHEGSEIGMAARALGGVERGIVQEGAAVSRGAGRAARAGEGAMLGGAGRVSGAGEHFGMKALEMMPYLADLPIGGDEDDTAPAAPSGPLSAPGARELSGAALMERAFRHGEPLERLTDLAFVWGAASQERVTARPVSRHWAFRYELSRTYNFYRPAVFMTLAPSGDVAFQQVTGAAPTPAERRSLDLDARTVAELGATRVSSREELWRTIEAPPLATMLFIAGWSRPGETRFTLPDGTHVREGDIQAACLAVNAMCFVMRRSGARGDARGAFVDEDDTLSMMAAAKAGVSAPSATARQAIVVLREARSRMALEAARALREPPPLPAPTASAAAKPGAGKQAPVKQAPGKQAPAKQAPGKQAPATKELADDTLTFVKKDGDAGLAPRPSEVSLTMLVGLGDSIYALTSELAREP